MSNITDSNSYFQDAKEVLLLSKDWRFDEKVVAGRHFKSVNFSKRNSLFHFKFIGCLFTDCNFENMGLNFLKFIDCTFNNCNFKKSIFTSVKFIECRLNTCNLDKAVVLDGKDPFQDCYLDYLNVGIIDGIKDTISSGTDLRAWKKCFIGQEVGVVVELKIPADAARVRPYGQNKCRASHAVIVDAPEGAYSWYMHHVKYVIGETIKSDIFNPDPWTVCTNGIHFFLTKQEASDFIF